MKVVVLALLACVSAIYAGMSAHNPHFMEFVKWLEHTGNRYHEEVDHRFTLFYETTQRIENNKDSFRRGLNQFSAMSSDEFAKYSCGGLISESFVPSTFSKQTEKLPMTSSIPVAYDWTLHGYNSPVKDQGECAACGAFSAVGAIEGGEAKRGTKVTLSEQQLIDCNANSRGCAGQLPALAIADIVSTQEGAVDSSEAYQYKAGSIWTVVKKDQCAFDAQRVASTVTGVAQMCNADSAACDEVEMANALFTNGPLSVCLDAALFQDYAGGIIDPKEGQCSADKINHCVTLVGYGSEFGRSFWKVKNSYGAQWGENGYARIARGKGACGINKIVSAPKF